MSSSTDLPKGLMNSLNCCCCCCVFTQESQVVLDKTRAVLWGGELVVTSAAAHSLPSSGCKKTKTETCSASQLETGFINIQQKQDLPPRKLAKEAFISGLPRHIRPSGQEPLQQTGFFGQYKQVPCPHAASGVAVPYFALPLPQHAAI